MKNRILTLIMMLLMGSAVVASAQNVRVGLRGGVNFADLKYEPKDQTDGTPDANSLTAYNVGVVVDIPLMDVLSIQTGAGLSSKGSKVEHSGAAGTYTQKINPLYVEIPANIVFKPQIAPDTRLYFGIGPYLGIGVGGKSSFEGDTPVGDFYSDHTLKYGDGSDADLKSTDVGANVLAGFEFGPGITLGAQYGMSFTNNAPGGNDNAPKILRNKVLSVNVGFLF